MATARANTPLSDRLLNLGNDHTKEEGMTQGNEGWVCLTWLQESISSSHLSPTIHSGGPSPRQRISQAGELPHRLISPHSWGGNRGPSKGWGHFLRLQALAGRKIKRLHSVSTALFQMLPLPFKRPSWAWVANEQFWGYHSQFLFSLPLPPSILRHICDGGPKSLLCFYS